MMLAVIGRRPPRRRCRQHILLLDGTKMRCIRKHHPILVSWHVFSFRLDSNGAPEGIS